MNPSPTSYPSGRRPAGFSLVEVLIALVVLSIGLLGIASLYNTSLQAGRSAITTTQAVTLASDMADRISANPAGGAAYAGAAGGNGCTDVDGQAAAICTPAQMAADDLALWQAQLDNALPAGVGAIQFTAGTPDRYDIRVTWTEPGIGTQRYTLTVQR